MKKISLYILFLSLLAACSTTPELHDTLAEGFNYLRFQVIYSASGIGTQDCRVEFNGKNIKEDFFPKEEYQGKLNVFYKDGTAPALTVENYNIKTEGNMVQVIQLPGKPLELFHAEDYITVKIKFQGKLSDYNLLFNGQRLNTGARDNYIKKDRASGVIKFYKKSGSATEPVFVSPEMEITGKPFTILQMAGKDEFIILKSQSDGEVSPPADPTRTKIRFLWRPGTKIDPNIQAQDSVFIEIISEDTDPNTLQPIINTLPRMIIKKDELSTYLELEIKTTRIEMLGLDLHTAFTYNLYDKDNNLLLEGRRFNLKYLFNEDKGYHTFKHKFQAGVITAVGADDPDFLIGEAWE